MQQKDFMFDLYRKGQKIFDDCSRVDYVKEFKEFKPDFLLYEKKSPFDYTLLGGFEIYDSRGDARYRHRNYPITSVPPINCGYFTYYFKDNELKYVSRKDKSGKSFGDFVKIDGNMQIHVSNCMATQLDRKILDIVILEEKEGIFYHMEISGIDINGHNVEYTIDSKNGMKYVYILHSYEMGRKKLVYSEKEKCYLEEHTDCHYIKSFENLLKDKYALFGGIPMLEMSYKRSLDGGAEILEDWE